jgi:hypothetical protein
VLYNPFSVSLNRDFVGNVGCTPKRAAAVLISGLWKTENNFNNFERLFTKRLTNQCFACIMKTIKQMKKVFTA